MRVHHVLPVNKQLDHAYWIGVPGRAFAWACRDEYPAPFFRRTFEWDGIAPARLSVAAAGYIEIHLNGEKVGDHVLDPTPTNFDKHLYLLEFNVEHLLRKGKNAVGVILGNSTYNCSTGGPWMLDEIPWRDYPKFILQLNVDGTPAVYSDPDWKFFGDGPIRMDEVKNGEFYDARLEQVGWDRPDFDDSRWSRAGVVHAPGGEIMRHTHEPCRVFRTFPMRRIGKNVYDSGQNLSGWVQIEVEGDPGSTVQIRYAEKIDEHGRIDQRGISRFVTTGSSVHSSYLSRRSSGRIRQILYVDSIPGVPNIPALKEFYQRLVAKGKKKMTARCACMRKMLLILRAMVVHKMPFDENFLENCSKNA